MHVRGEEGVGDIMAEWRHCLDQLLRPLQEVEGDEADAMVLPEDMRGTPPRGDDDLGPVCDYIHSNFSLMKQVWRP